MLAREAEEDGDLLFRSQTSEPVQSAHYAGRPCVRWDRKFENDSPSSDTTDSDCDRQRAISNPVSVGCDVKSTGRCVSYTITSAVRQMPLDLLLPRVRARTRAPPKLVAVVTLLNHSGFAPTVTASSR